MSIGREQVEYVANLSRIWLDEEEKDTFARQLADIVSYIDKLNELDTSDVEPLTNVSGLTNVFREDKLRPSFERDDMLRNSPKQAYGYYQVPKIIE